MGPKLRFLGFPIGFHQKPSHVAHSNVSNKSTPVPFLFSHSFSNMLPVIKTIPPYPVAQWDSARFSFFWEGFPFKLHQPITYRMPIPFFPRTSTGHLCLRGCGSKIDSDGTLDGLKSAVFWCHFGPHPYLCQRCSISLFFSFFPHL